MDARWLIFEKGPLFCMILFQELHPERPHLEAVRVGEKASAGKFPGGFKKTAF